MVVCVRRVLSAWTWKSRARCRASGFYFDKETIVGIFEVDCTLQQLVHGSTKLLLRFIANGANKDVIQCNTAS